MSENYTDIMRKFFKFLKSYNAEKGKLIDLSYRILKIPNDQDEYIYFQVKGTFFSTKMLPEELMHSDLLLGFSKADIAIITHLGTKKELENSGAIQPKLWARIARQIFGLGGKTRFMLKMPEQEQLVEAVPEEVMTNKEALYMLQGHDAAMIGYAAAENRLLEIRQETASAPTCRLLKHDLFTNRITYLDLERDNQHTLALEEVFHNKALLGLFPKTTQQIISFVAGELHQQRVYPRHHVKFRLLSYAGKQAEYRNETGEVIKTGFLDLAFEPELLDEFSQQDRDMIRFAAGELTKEKQQTF